MIVAQLTTEIFGVLAPGRPEVALDIACYQFGQLLIFIHNRRKNFTLLCIPWLH